ncbi:MAG: NAD(P)/FAD-dependent oxidoreductase [Allosphingosinicella sp.]|uniref:NAD(P)/FAD-dependent oxidoreductase n=1 Tax=Allosphingosinicella sp. TaxID=2823234 RepID=UPI0039305C1C
MTATRFFDVVIVGAGHAGAQCAVALRQQGFDGSIALVGAEPDPPYDRTCLSKDYLAGTKPFERMLLRPPGFWAERNIAHLSDTTIVAVRPDLREVRTSAGERIGWTWLIWAAGGKPRRLSCPGVQHAGVHTIRSRADVDMITKELPGADQVTIVGGGYVGLETAAVLAAAGKRVTLVHSSPRLLSRVAGEPVARFLEQEHRRRGVDVRTSMTVTEIEGRGGRVEAVRLSDGSRVRSQLVIVGIGILPCVELLREAGARGTDGVDVDDHCRTSIPGTLAIGDCAAHPNRYAGRPIRIESIQNANDQAATAARLIAGKPQPYDALPWFWSHQYEFKLQSAGLAAGHDDMIVRGDPSDGSFSVVYLRDDVPVALDAINAVRDFIQGKHLIQQRLPICRRRLASGEPLKDLAA